MLNPDNLFARNMNFAGSIKYDLEQVHDVAVADTIHKISDNLMIDAQSLSVCLRATATFYEDDGQVLLANVPQRAKSINEFTLLITSIGTGKSLIFSKIMRIHELKRQYDMKIERESNSETEKHKNYRHAIVNEITGPGLTKFLDMAGNILVLIDEFDGDHQKLGLFCSEVKSSTLNTSAASVLKSFHTGMPFYQKGKVSDSGQINNPQVSFLAASNGAPALDVLRAKIKSSVMPDAMVMRTIFEVIDSPPKFNSNLKNKFLSPETIGIELLLLAMSLISDQTYVFDTVGEPSADKTLQDWQDMCFASCDRWKHIDRWTSSRFAKTSELTARLAAQLAHIGIAFDLLNSFITSNNLTNLNNPVTFTTYRDMMNFFHEKMPPFSRNPIVISRNQVDSAIYVTKIILLKFFNLFNLDHHTAAPIDEIPWIPSNSNNNSNRAVVNIPPTQNSTTEEKSNEVFLELCQLILKFPSICFTITQISNKYPKLKCRYQTIKSILHRLTEMNLLIKFEKGLRSGPNVCDLFVKCLPNSITFNTVNTFVKECLDPVKMPWTLYKSSCERVLLPSLTSVLTEEVKQLFDQTSYSRTIEKYETSTPPSRKNKKSSNRRESAELAGRSVSNESDELARGSGSNELAGRYVSNKSDELACGSGSNELAGRHEVNQPATRPRSTLDIDSSPEPPFSSTGSILPCPPLQSIRLSNDSNIDETSNESAIISSFDIHDSSINNEQSETTDSHNGSLNSNESTNKNNFRRSNRTRTKNKRLSSSSSSEIIYNTNKRKKT